MARTRFSKVPVAVGIIAGIAAGVCWWAADVAASPGSGTSTVFDRTFTRQSGQPVPEVETVNWPRPGYFTLRIVSQGTASAVILLNGESVAAPSDFSAHPATIERTVQLKASNKLSVEMRGAPGGTIRVWIFTDDLKPPVIRAIGTPPPNARGWNATDVVVSFECSDEGSGVATCPPPVPLTSEGAKQKISGTAIDKAGNASSASVIVNIDKTAPAIVGAANPPPNAEGWHRSDVKVIFTCSDNLSGIEECTKPQQVSGDGTRQVQGTARDRAGHVANTVVTVKIDATPPAIVATPDRPPDVSTWYTRPVTVTFTCADTGSGIASCPEPVRVIATGEHIVVAGTAFDRAGNSKVAKLELSVRTAGTAPTITAQLTPAPNAAGWNNSDVVVSFTCVDTGSGVQSCPPPRTVPTEGAQQITGSTADPFGNTASVTVAVRIDRTPPSIVATVDSAANAAGWHHTPVTIGYACTDNLSGIAACSSPSVISQEGAGQLATGAATDQAGNTASASLTINLDATPPVIRAIVGDPGAVSNHDVTVTFECSDALSGVTTCPAPVVVSTEGLHQPISGTATDAAGNSAVGTVSVSLDRTRPSISAAGSPSPNGAGWNNTPVTVRFTCSDSGSSIVTCPDPITVTNNAAGQVVSGEAVDAAGNRSQVSVTLNIDTIAPTIVATLATAANENGWNNAPVSVAFACVDEGSSIASCSTAVEITTDGEHNVVGTAADLAGNSASVTQVVRLDQLAPAVTLAQTPAANGAGWNNTDVAVSYSCVDPGSGVAVCPAPRTIATEGAQQAVEVSVVDRAGNATQALTTVSIDKTAPTIHLSSSPPANAAGWNNTPVTVSFTCSDSLSEIDSCPSPSVVNNSVMGRVVSGTAVDRAGNSAEASMTVSLDLTAPVIHAIPTPAANAAGWNNAPVTVSFVCEDPLGEVSSCPAPVTVSNEGANQVVSGQVSDRAGHISSVSLTLNLDFTPPQIAASITPPANPAGWHALTATVTFTCADGLSQIATCTAPTVVSGGAGQTIAGTAVDRAGNLATASALVNVDASAPTVVPSLSPAPNAAGWNNTDVTVSFQCSDTGAGVVECPASFTVTTEGANQMFTRTMLDRAGNSVVVTPRVSLDRTPPSISITGPVENAVLRSSPARVTALLTDALSGIATASCGSAPLPATATLECDRPLVSGVNSIQVRVTDIAGNEATAMRTVSFEQTRLPRAFAGGPYRSVAGTPITLNGTASFDPDGHVLTYAWTFGDNATGVGAQPQHIYAATGTYTATLTVDNGAGGRDVASAQVLVDRANTTPVANAGGPYAVDIGASLRFDASTSSDADGDALTVTWAFGDGGVGAGFTPLHTYGALGNYTATVTTIDGHGGTSSASADVTVRSVNHPPIANVGGPYTGEVGRPIHFDAAASIDPDGDTLSFAWTFGDTGTATGPASSRTFATAGVFAVTVTVSDGRGGITAASAQATVTPANRLPSAEANGPYTQEEGFPVAFSSAGSNDPDGDALTFTWRFGDGRSNTGASPSPSYLSAGTYTVELTVDDGRGGVATDTATVTITPRTTQENRNPIAALGGPFTTETGVPLTFDPTGSVDPDGDALAFAWTFGDGQSSSERSPAHAWPQTGTFSITLTVSDGRGGSATATSQALVTAATDRAPPLLTLHGPTQVLPGTRITVTAQVADASPITGVRFDFVDGTSTTDNEPPFERTIDVPSVASPGQALLVHALATDAAGNVGSAEHVMTIVDRPDDAPPTVVLNRPAQTAPGASLRIAADAHDDVGVRAVTFFVNDVVVSVDTEAPYATAITVPADAAVGSVVNVAARARDFTGNEAEAIGAVSVVAGADNTPPTLELSAPPMVSPGSTFRVFATPADDSGIANLQLSVDGVPAADLAAAPFQLDVDVPATALHGSILRIEGKAVDFAGLEATASTTVRVVSTLAVGDGLVIGEVYDDATGLPLAAARVRLTGRTEAGIPFAVEAESDARGAYTLRGPAGTGTIAVTRDGWTRAERSIVVTNGLVQYAIDARLGPYTISQPISPVLGGTINAGDVQVIVRPGGVGQSITLRARRVSAQGLLGPLPIGWAPIAAVDLSPANVEFTVPATFQAPGPAGIAPGRMLHLVTWDAAVSGWRVVDSQPVPPVGGPAFDLHRTGQYALIVGDIAPVAPPISAAGELLLGAAVSALPGDAAATVIPQPRVILYRPGVRSDVSTEVPLSQPRSSGTRFQASIQETYQFADNTTARLDPYVQDLFFHQSPADPARLRASYPVSTSLQVEPLAMREGVIAVDVHDAPGTTAAPAISAAGGVVDGAGGLRLAVPPGATGQLASVALQPLTTTALGLPLPNGVTFVGGATISLSAILAGAASLSMPRPDGLDANAALLLVRVSEVAGASRLILAALGRIDIDRVTTVLQLPRNGIALTGIRESGRYAFLAVPSGVAYAFGLVFGTGGASFKNALVTSDTFEIAALSGTGGNYVSVLRPAVTTLSARDVLRGDAGTARITPAAPADEIAVDLRLHVEAPRVTSVTPANGAENVAPTTPIVVRFSEPIDPASIADASSVVLTGPAGAIDGTLGLSDGNTTLTFRPLAELVSDAEYTVRISGVLDRAGNGLAAPFVTSFSSLDTSAPEPPPAGVISASIPGSNGLTTIVATQGAVGSHDIVMVVNETRRSSMPVLVQSNGGFSVNVAAGITDRLRLSIRNPSGRETSVAIDGFRQVNPNGSISAAVSAAGGHIEGPSATGLAVDVQSGTFPTGAVVTIKAITEAQFPSLMTVEQRAVFAYAGGFEIDFGGVTPTRYVNVSIPAGANDKPGDQWIVSHVTQFAGETVLGMVDTAKLIDGKVKTSSPPCPGVTAAGVYGVHKSGRSFGMTYGTMSPTVGQVASRIRSNPLAQPFLMPVLAVANDLPVGVCLPALTGQATIVPSNFRIHVAATELRPADVEIQITNTLRGNKVTRFFRPFDETFTIEGGNGDSYKVEAVGFLGARRTLASTPIARSYRRIDVEATEFNLDDASVEVRKVVTGQTIWSSPLNRVGAHTRKVSTIVEATANDILLVKAIDGSGAARDVISRQGAHPFGNGDLLLRAIPGTIDPTHDEIVAFNNTLPPDQRLEVNGVVSVDLHKVEAGAPVTEVIFDVAGGSVGNIVGGGIAYATTGTAGDRFDLSVRYENGRVEVVTIPTFKVTVKDAAGQIVKEIEDFAPPPNEPLKIDLSPGAAPPVLTTAGGFLGFDAQSPLTLSFSKPLDPASVKKYLKLYGEDLSGNPYEVVGIWQVSEGGRDVTFVPADPIRMGTTYRVGLSGVTSGGTPLPFTSIPVETFTPIKLSSSAFPPPHVAVGLTTGPGVAGSVPFQDVEIAKDRLPTGEIRTVVVAATANQTGYKFHDFNVTHPRTPVEIGHTAGGQPKRIRALPGVRPAIDIIYDVPLAGQQTSMSCWAASAAMIVAFRDQQSIDPIQMATAAGYWATYAGGLPLSIIKAGPVFSAFGLVPEPPQSVSVSRVQQMLEDFGPLWVGASEGIGAHVRVVTGLSGDGTPDGTLVHLNDPWQTGWQPGRGPNAGEQLTETFTEFSLKQDIFARRAFGEESMYRRMCTSGVRAVCDLLEDPGFLVTLRLCNAGDQSACDELELVGDHTVLFAHLPTLPPHATPVPTGTNAIALQGGTRPDRTTPDIATRIAMLAPCNQHVTAGLTDPLFQGDLLVAPLYSSFGSSVNFFDITDRANPCLLGGRPLTRNPETVVSELTGDHSAHGAIKQFGYARGAAVLRTETGVAAYVAVAELGLMPVDVGKEIPSRSLEILPINPIYPGDYVDVVPIGNHLLALNNNSGSAPSLEAFDANLSPIGRVSFAAARDGYSKVHQVIAVAKALVRRPQADGSVSIGNKDLAFVSGANGITIIDVSDLENMWVTGQISTPGIVRQLAVTRKGTTLFAAGDKPPPPGSGGHQQSRGYVIDVSNPYATGLIDRDHDLQDDRIIFELPYDPAVEGDVTGMDYDDARGLAYVASNRSLDIWAISRQAASYNQPPVANAGPDQTVITDSTARLDGRGSSDPNGDPLTYSWSQTSGAAVVLDHSNIARPSFSTAGLSDGDLTFSLTVSDGLATSGPDSVTITISSEELVLEPGIIALPIVPGSKQLRLAIVGPTTTTDVHASANTEYRWIGNKLGMNIGGVDVQSILNELGQKLHIPVPLATIAIDSAGMLTATGPGIQVVRAHYDDHAGRVLDSDFAVVIAGIALEGITLAPESALTLVAGALAAAIGVDGNPPLILTADDAGIISDKGLIILEDVEFKLLGAATINVKDLVEIIGKLIAHRIAGALPGVIGTASRWLITRAFRDLIGIGGTQFLDDVESSDETIATITNSIPKGIVRSVDPGLGSVSGTLDLGDLGKADDSVLVWVLAHLVSAEVVPDPTVMLRTDPPSPGPHVRTFVEADAGHGTVTVKGKAPSESEFLDSVIPRGLAFWLSSSRTLTSNLPESDNRFHIRGSLTTSCTGPDADGKFTCTLGFTDVGLGFFVPNIVTTYTIADTAIAQLGAADLLSLNAHLEHQGVVGHTTIRADVSIPLLGSTPTSPPADIFVLDGGPILEKVVDGNREEVLPGESIKFIVTVTNPYDHDLTGVQVTDRMFFTPTGSASESPFGSTHVETIPTIAAHGSATFEYTATAPTVGGVWRNEVSATGSAPADVKPTVIAPVLEIEVANGVHSIPPGASGLMFDITVTNPSSSLALANVAVSNQFFHLGGSGFETALTSATVLSVIPSLAPGQSVTLQATAPDLPNELGMIRSEASAPTAASVSASVPFVAPILTKRETNPGVDVEVGDLVEFTVTVQNPTDLELRNLEVRDTTFFTDDGTIFEYELVGLHPIGTVTVPPQGSVTIQTSVTPTLPGELRNEVTADNAAPSSVSVDVDLAPIPRINEIVVTPFRDWDDSGPTGGNGTPFDNVPGNAAPGSAAITTADQWIEFWTEDGDPTDLDDFDLIFTDTTGVVRTLALSSVTLIPTAPHYLVLGNPGALPGGPTVAIAPTSTIILRLHPTLQTVDEVNLALVPPATAGADSISRVPDGGQLNTPTSFQPRVATIGAMNIP